MELSEIEKRLQEIQNEVAELREARKEAVDVEAQKLAGVVGKDISALMALLRPKGAFFTRFQALKKNLDSLRTLDPNAAQRFSDPLAQGLVDSGVHPDTTVWRLLGWLSKKGEILGGDA
jgi:Zn-dependent oligopeptidase